jgi:DNA-binding GntR family transcriptional regulator
VATESDTDQSFNGDSKTPFQVAERIRRTILEEQFRPGDRLTEAELSEQFKVSRSPIREALLALEKEGSVVLLPYRGAIVTPLSAEEAEEIAELRLAVIPLIAKAAYPHLSPADFALAEKAARVLQKTKDPAEYYHEAVVFWDVILKRANRPIAVEVFRQLQNRGTRYIPLILRLFSDPESRPRQREEFARLIQQGKIAEAVRTFRKLYFEVMNRLSVHLRDRALTEHNMTKP